MDQQTKKEVLKYGTLVVALLIFALVIKGTVGELASQKAKQGEPTVSPAQQAQGFSLPDYDRRLTVDKEVVVYAMPQGDKVSGTRLVPYTLVKALAQTTGDGQDWVQVEYVDKEGNRAIGFIKEAETMPFVDGMEKLVQQDMTK
jgi:uncharacterized membrane protein YdfJ with MMPL/SSD domain